MMDDIWEIIKELLFLCLLSLVGNQFLFGALIPLVKVSICTSATP